MGAMLPPAMARFISAWAKRSASTRWRSAGHPASSKRCEISLAINSSVWRRRRLSGQVRIDHLSRNLWMDFLGFGAPLLFSFPQAVYDSLFLRAVLRLFQAVIQGRKLYMGKEPVRILLDNGFQLLGRGFPRSLGLFNLRNQIVCCRRVRIQS